LRDQVANYDGLKEYWTKYFYKHNVKLYTTWWKNDGTHCVIADALRELGGISTLYQRSFEAHPNPQLMIDADIVFGFSGAVAEVEREGNSNIRYHVATGYLGDHRFKLLRERAGSIRKTLQINGAKRVMSFADQGSSTDPRWSLNDDWARAEYRFLCHKVLENSWFGLVLKPKVPRTFRSRLGLEVMELLERAIATGRCYVYETADDAQSAHPPCEAALVADVAVDGYLRSSTAALESVLAGIPTLLLDREGWTVSPLYDLGVGTVIFKDFDSLWEACIEHWNSEMGILGFGDWTPMLDYLDPFRDGKAAYRMGTYLHWMLQGLKKGIDRESVMAEAAERYCEIWGYDKIAEIGSPV